MKSQLKGDEYAERFRVFATKIQDYVNSSGSKIGWDGGLHTFLKMLDKAEITLDKNIAKAKFKARAKKILTAVPGRAIIKESNSN